MPRTSYNELMGLMALHGHVVQTVGLLGDPVPTWSVDPPQTVRVTQSFMSQYGPITAGTKLLLRGVPDEYLRPFDDFPPEELQVDERELTT